MKGGKKFTLGGFGSAAFAINDIQNFYGSLDDKHQQYKQITSIKSKQTQNKPAIQVATKKQFLSQKQSQKPKIILKQPIKPNSRFNSAQGHIKKVLSQKKYKQEPTQSKKTSQIKQPRVLNCLKVAESVFQLTFSNKPTQWEYHIFSQEGKNAQQIVPDPKITFSLNERNIRQGSIGNCYFVCSLAALTKNIEIIKRRIPDHQKYNEKSKCFKVNMFESGKLVSIKVLNSFQHHFSKPIQNDITPLVLQKAYAQLYGNYEIINLGHSIDSFRDLSGNIAEYIDLKEKNKCIKEVIDAFQNNHPMAIASKVKPVDGLISAKHSYNVLSYSYKDGDFLIQLRDPRGWTKASFNLPVYLESNIENGQFWIGYKDLVANFEVITVSRYMPKSSYYYKTYSAKQIPVNGLKAIMFEIIQGTVIGASMHQKHKKFFDNNHQYNVVNLMVCKVDINGYPTKTLKTGFNAQQVCCISLQLQKGFYAIVAQIHPFRPTKQAYPQQVFTLSINTCCKIGSFKEIPHFNIDRALVLYMQQNKNEFKALISQQGLQRHHGSLFGKVCILYQNYSDKNVIEELEFQTENIEIKEKKVTLQKGQVKIISHSIGPANNCSHKCVFKSKTFYKK